MNFFEFFENLNACHFRHLIVEDHNVWLFSENFLKSLTTVAGFNDLTTFTF